MGSGFNYTTERGICVLISWRRRYNSLFWCKEDVADLFLCGTGRAQNDQVTIAAVEYFMLFCSCV